MSGAITKVTVKLNQLSHTYPDDIDVLLVAPGGQKCMLMSSCGGANGVTGVMLTFDDAAAANLPDSGQIVSGTYKPTMNSSANNLDAPAPAGPYTTSLANFSNAAPNGVWSLFVRDHGPGDQGNIAGGWSLTITTPTNAPPSITGQPSGQTVAVGANASFTVTASGTAPLSYSWQFNGTPINGATTSSLTVNNAQYANAGNYNVIVTNSFGSATSAIAALTVTAPASSGTFSNTTTITIPLKGNGSPFPSPITVAGLTGNILKITATIYQFSHTYPDDVDVLLVGPGGQKGLLISYCGGGNPVNGVNLTFDAAATASLPDSGQIVSGTYKPTAFSSINNFSSPAPSGPYPVSLAGFSNAAPNGVWSLYVEDHGPGDQGTIGGWSLTIQTPGPTNQAPSISVPPAGQTVAVGANPTFNVTAGGTAPLSYQWQFNGSPISNATNTSLSLSGVQLSDGGNYTVVVSNFVGSITSAVAVLTVLNPPTITSPPQDSTNLTGTIANFSAGVLGSPTLVYRWRQNGVGLTDNARISGSATASLTISNVQPTDAGSYTLFVTNAVGAVTSAPAALTVNGPPFIFGQSGNQTVAVGANPTFNVSATGTAPLTYQWQLNGGPIGGATSSSLTLSNVQSTDSGGGYNAIVNNGFGSATSVVAILTVLTPPSITPQPQNATNFAGTTASFTSGATGSPTLSYRWQFNGTPLADGSRITGSGTSSLTISNVQNIDAGNYTLVVTNTVGSTTSAVAVLAVIGPPTISGQPVSRTVIVGTNVSFFVAASGAGPLGYQWRKGTTILSDGGRITGSGNSLLSISSVQTNDAGGYQVIVTNLAGGVTSSVATLTVTTSLGGCLGSAPAGIIGWWPGEGNALDVAGTDNGSLVGGATANTPGVVGNAFNFDGTNGYVSIPDNSLLRPTNLTIECWVRFTSLNSPGNASVGQQYIVFKQNSRTTGQFEGYTLGKERLSPSDFFTFQVTSSSGASASVDSTTAIQTGVWYHVAATRGPNYIQIFVNGKLEAQASVSFPQDYGPFPLYFATSGQSYWDRKLSGNLDEVSLYNRALTTNEIAAIYAAGSNGKCQGNSAPSIIGQPQNQIYSSGGSATFSVSAVGSPPLFYRWYRDGFFLSNDARTSGTSNSTLSIINLQSSDIGNYQVNVSNSLGNVMSAVASLSTGVPPTNDNFSAGAPISGTTGSIHGNNAAATKESGEPNHAGNAGGHSVWYNWTAPSSSAATFDTAMSAFDTLLAVYTGNSVGGLTLIASNDNISTNNSRSRVTFTPVAGTVYHIAVDGANGANGNLTLRWANAATPLPDLSIVASALNPRITTETFGSGSCAVVEGLIQAGTRRLIRFDTETENSGTADLFFGDPSANPLFVWAACHAHYHFQNYMAYRLRDSSGRLVALGLKVGFCVLDVFRWSSGAPNSAKYSCNNQGIQVGWGDLYDSTLDGQWIDITGLPDGNYVIEVEANPLGIIQESNYGNNLVQVPISIGNPNAPPLNDNFANSQALLGGFSSVVGNNANATKEAGEPNHAGNAGGHSLWYSWNAPSTKSVTIDTMSSSFNTLLAVYTGSSVSSLSAVASNDDIVAGSTLQSRVTFNATAGVNYMIAVDGFNGATGSVVLTLNQTIQNDNFLSCQYIGGVSGVVYGSNAGATKESGEPDHAGNPGGQSVWYCWTAPIGGTVTFDTTGSTFNTLLAAYTGSAVNNLTLVANNDDITPGSVLQSRISFTAVGLSRYNIVIDGYNGDSGDTTLTWNLVGSGGNVVLAGVVDKTGALSPNGAVLKYSFLPDGEFQLGIEGASEQHYRVERSCDLVHWLPLVTTLADYSGKASFIDKAAMHVKSESGDPICGAGKVVGVTAASGAEARFYRAVAVPNP
jgi:subtilisin-like proprotein convertase family protein